MADEQQQQQLDWSFPALDDIGGWLTELNPGWGDSIRAALIRYMRSPDTPTAVYMANLIDDTAEALDLEWEWHSWGYPNCLLNHLHSFGDMILEAVNQIPRTHPAQDRLAAMLAELAKKPGRIRKTLRHGQDIRYEHLQLWMDSGSMTVAMREFKAHPSGPWEGCQTPDEWVNHRAFEARLVACGFLEPGREAATSWGMPHLRDGLERPPPDEPGLAACYVVAAAQWFAYASAFLFPAPDQRPPVTEHDRRWQSAGELFDGPPGLSRKRWDFWKARFRQLGQELEEAREDAEMAVVAMEAVEKEKAKEEEE